VTPPEVAGSRRLALGHGYRYQNIDIDSVLRARPSSVVGASSRQRVSRAKENVRKARICTHHF